MPSPITLKWRSTPQRIKERLIHGLLLLCALLSIVTTLGIITVLFLEAVWSPGENPAFFQQVSLSDFLLNTEWEPIYSEQYGIWPLLSGTLVVAVIAAAVGLPIGVFSAVYLSEYATPRARGIIKPILEILAGIPTIVYGYFALVFVTPYILEPIFSGWFGLEIRGSNALAAGLVVGTMILPTVTSLSEDALRAVPRSLREAGYALGSTKFQVSSRVVLPAAFSGIMASFLLGISRAIGETMAVTIAAGRTPNLTANPLESVYTMTAFIVSTLQGDVDPAKMGIKSAYAVAMTLFLITLGMNIISQFVLRRFREVYE